jgi:predicted transcriptional regulator
MKYFKKILFAQSIIIISLLLYSCGTKHSISNDVIYKNDNFTYKQLMNGGAVIGGIASQEIDFTKNERIQHNSHLSTITIKELKDVRIINTLQLMGKIGKDNYYSIIKEYDIEQMLSIEDMRVINESIPEIEYIIFAYIESENISNDSYTESTADSEGKYKTVFKTTYSLTAEFQIYDVLKEQLVWNNIMYNEAVKTQDRTEDSFLDVVVGDVMSDAFVTIDREDVLEEIYEKFAEDLAKIQY